MCIFYLINKDQYYEFKVVINLTGVVLLYNIYTWWFSLDRIAIVPLVKTESFKKWVFTCVPINTHVHPCM
jgi:hypothetical protein